MEADAEDRSLKDVVRVFRGHGWNAVWMVVFFLIADSPNWVVPIMISRMIDLKDADPNGRIFRLAVYAAIMLVVIAQNLPMNVLYVRHRSRMSRGAGRDLRVRLCRQLQQLSLLYHDRTSVGKMHSKTIRDIEVIESVPHMVLIPSASLGIRIVTAAITLSMRAPVGIVFFAVLVPLTVWIRTIFRKRWREHSQRYRESVEEMSAGLSDMLVMMPVTRAHGLEKHELATVGGKIDYVYRSGRAFDRLGSWFAASIYVTFHLMRGVFLVGAIYFCFAGKISVGDVLVFSAFFALLCGSMGGLLNALPVIARAKESVASVKEVLNAPDLEENEGRDPVPSVEGRFEFEDVGFAYPDTEKAAIVGLSLRVEPGESIAFVGPSGCGKSTTLSLLLGFVRPDEGQILLDGRDMDELDLRQYRRHVGVVTQDTVFFSGTVRDNVAYGREGVSDERIVEALRAANAMEFIEELPEGLNTQMGEDGIKLSGGQQQRLAIARALVRDPRVLILDEATSALDADSEVQVQEALEHVMVGRTTFIVAHRLSTVRYATRIIVMEEGRAVAEGTHEELMERDNFYSRSVRMQSLAQKERLEDV